MYFFKRERERDRERERQRERECPWKHPWIYIYVCMCIYIHVCMYVRVYLNINVLRSKYKAPQPSRPMSLPKTMCRSSSKQRPFLGPKTCEVFGYGLRTMPNFIKTKSFLFFCKNMSKNWLDINWWIEISFLNIFWQNKIFFLKKIFQYLENDPLNGLNLILDTFYVLKATF